MPDKRIIQIPVTVKSIHGTDILVDEEDIERLSKYRWTIGQHGYAVTSTSGAKCLHCGQTKKISILMHRFLLGEHDGVNTYVDHRNRNRLDNRKANLRWVTQAKNMSNLGVRKDSKSGVRGVTWDKERDRWFVSIRQAGKTIALGRYDNLAEAETVWLEKFKEIHGE